MAVAEGLIDPGPHGGVHRRYSSPNPDDIDNQTASLQAHARRTRFDDAWGEHAEILARRDGAGFASERAALV